MSWEPFRRIPLWKDVPLEQWETYLWQMANRIQTVEQLRQVIHLTPSEEQAVTRRAGRFRRGRFVAKFCQPGRAQRQRGLSN